MSRSYLVSRAVPTRAAVGLLLVALLSLAAPDLDAQNQPDWVHAGMGVEYGHAMAYDAARDRVVLFGGRDAAGHLLGQTWEWDGTQWTEYRPATRPPARAYHAMAYDASRQRVVMHGGIQDDYWFTPLGDTWEWDGADWTQHTPASGPAARYYHAMVYDPDRQRTLMVSGRTPSMWFQDAWEWDGSTWTATTAPPVGRSGHGISYDTSRQRVVLFGGFDPSGANVTETWERDGATWTLRSAAGGPSARNSFSMAFDANQNVTVLHGGTDNWIWEAPSTDPTNGLDDTWEWDGTRWTQRAPSTQPVARWSSGMVYDSSRAHLVLFGGQPDTWAWDGNDWTAQTAVPIRPSRRQSYGMAFDAARQRTLMFGGLLDNLAVAPDDETWEWDGSAWAQRTPANQPPARLGGSMVYDAARQRVLLYGGQDGSLPAGQRVLSDTWEWDGSDWTQRSPANTPGPRSYPALAYDAARQRVVLFGGGGTSGHVGDTWEWDGVDWTQRFPTNAPSPRLTQMAYDPLRQRVVLFGGLSGITRLGETWEWDGSDWIQRFPANAPSDRWGHSMAYDQGRQRIVLLGGNPGDDFWEWDGSDWVERSTANLPRGRIHSQLTPDAHGHLVLFGGNPISADTWLYTTPAMTLPFGQGCSLGSAPKLRGTAPKLGGVLGFDLVAARPSTVGAFGLSGAPAAASLPPCTLYLGGAIIWLPAATNGAGFAASLRFSVPDDPTLRGAQLYSQALAVDPQGPILGLAFSAGLQMTLGK